MNAYRNYNNNTSALSSNLEKLSSGYKINRAGDDAAGLAISEKMRAQISGLEQASSNVKDGISLVKTGEGALQEVQDMLNRMVTLATQSANGTYDDETDRAQLQKEVDSLKTEINRIADSANFNGISLLDGSLESTQAITSIEVTGKTIDVEDSAGAKGKYTTSAGLSSAATYVNGDKISFHVGLSDGTSQTVTLTVASDASSTANKVLKAEDGTVYNLNTAKTITTAEAVDAFVAELNKTSVADKFTVTKGTTDGTLVFEAKEEGSSAPTVTTVEESKYILANDSTSFKTMAASVTTKGLDAGVEIDFTSITEFNGTNFEKAVFSINGHQFLLMSTDIDPTDTAKKDEYLRAIQGVGSDVTILVGGNDATKNGLLNIAGNKNWTQNIQKIAEVTGLDVTDGIDESSTINGKHASSTGISAGSGIRLTIGKNSVTKDNGLQLQIGDTSDSFNQLKVSIEDMHTNALGIDDIDISTQSGAAAAIDKIKAAINSVSSTRGTLGATQNRLEHTANNLSVMTENIQDAESTIRDTDIAEEMMSYTKNNILVQSAQAMLAQANSVPQGVLQLLQ
jgi:flagellin